MAEFNVPEELKVKVDQWNRERQEELIKKLGKDKAYAVHLCVQAFSTLDQMLKSAEHLPAGTMQLTFGMLDNQVRECIINLTAHYLRDEEKIAATGAAAEAERVIDLVLAEYAMQSAFLQKTMADWRRATSKPRIIVPGGRPH